MSKAKESHGAWARKAVPCAEAILRAAGRQKGLRVRKEKRTFASETEGIQSSLPWLLLHQPSEGGARSFAEVVPRPGRRAAREAGNNSSATTDVGSPWVFRRQAVKSGKGGSLYADCEDTDSLKGRGQRNPCIYWFEPGRGKERDQ
jgi:hypothetical protein